MENTVKFGDIGDGPSFDAVPADRYTLECVDAKLATSKKGNQKVSAQFKIVGGDLENRRVWNDFSLLPNSWFHLKNYFEAAGVDVEDQEITFDDILSMLGGTQVSAYVSTRDYKGKTQNDVSDWKPVGAGEDSVLGF
jgi:hypothetical protein